MKKPTLLGAMLCAAILAAPSAAAHDAAPSTTQHVDADPFLWMEEMEGERPLAWAKTESDRSRERLQASPRYQPLFDQALALSQAKDRIAYARFDRGGVSNFWQDEKHVRGIWRETSLDSYRSDAPNWSTILDIDALAAKEGKNWVYAGADCLRLPETRCLIYLSDGGKDAVVIREFDRESKSFIEDGFILPEGKQNVTWLDRDHLLIARDWGEGSMTHSGYASILKKLKRGQSLDHAEELFRGEATDVWTTPFILRDRDDVVHAVGAVRVASYHHSEVTLFRPEGPLKLNLPNRLSFGGLVKGRLLLTTAEDWTLPSGETFTAGSLLSYDLQQWKADPHAAKPSLVFAPNARQSISSYRISGEKLVLNILDNVRGQAFLYDYRGGSWHAERIPLPDHASISISSTSTEHDQILFSVSNYLTPSTLYLYNSANKSLEKLKSLSPRFDASRHVVEQLEAKSKDGTAIPYFIVRPKKIAKKKGGVPTLLYGYGGFQISQLPGYSSGVGKMWLEQGNAYAVANIRGGGEFGPNWHEAARGENKQRTWDDFAAVAEDMQRRGLTSPTKLGIMGGSQGGLLVSTVMTQRPELFNAAIIQVPLIDMLRFHKLGAGASYIGEYGNPDNVRDHQWLAAYSPYNNLSAGKAYPTPLIVTSTKDDRVHPAHARKFAAKMGLLGHDFLYLENMDGGHSAAANLQESAAKSALEYSYLYSRLVD